MLRISLVILSMCFSTFSAYASTYDGKILQISTSRVLTQQVFFAEISTHHLVVLGEKHYTPAIQALEGLILVEYSKLRKPFSLTLGWEFLAWTNQRATDAAYADFLSSKSTVLDFFNRTLGKADEYAPLLEAAKSGGALVKGLNLTRAEKSPVTKSGISALDPKLLPKGFQLLGAGYRERFEAVMGSHVPPQSMDNYFAAQCLTDDVMADQTVSLLANTDSMVLVAGSFHTDYYDGTVARIIARDPNEDLISVRIIDASDYTESELKDYLRSTKYGVLADFAVFINEPTGP